MYWICIENQFESDSELFISLIDEINDEWIKTLNNRIAYYHLHNNHGKQTIYGYNKDDEHLNV